MESMDYWRLCDELTIVQAALLVAGEDPSAQQSWVENWEPDKRPDGYEAAKAAIRRALLGSFVEGEIMPYYETDINGNNIGPIDNTIDIEASYVVVDSLKVWLSSKGFSTGFFFPDPKDTYRFLDPKQERYAPKLAATVRAWEALSTQESLGGKSPKQALMKWLRENGAEYGLTDEEGVPNETGIEECAKVANWQDKGGAPKTPR